MPKVDSVMSFIYVLAWFTIYEFHQKYLFGREFRYPCCLVEIRSTPLELVRFYPSKTKWIAMKAVKMVVRNYHDRKEVQKLITRRIS